MNMMFLDVDLYRGGHQISERGVGGWGVQVTVKY